MVAKIKQDKKTGKFVKGTGSGRTVERDKKNEENERVWNEVINIKQRLLELDELIFKYLNGDVTLSREQVQVLNKTMDIYSSKEIPDAKAMEVDDSKELDITIGLPKKPKK